MIYALLFHLLILLNPAFQYTVPQHTGATASSGGGGGTWSLVTGQHAFENTGATTVAFTNNVGAGHAVIVFINNGAGSSPGAPTMPGVSAFVDGGSGCALYAGSTACVQIYVGCNVTGGNKTVTVSATNLSAHILEISNTSGIPSVCPDKSSANANATGGAIGNNNINAGTAQTTTANDACFGGYGANGGPLTAGNTIAWTSDDGDHTGLLERFFQTSSGSIQSTATDGTGGDGYGGVMGCIKHS